MNGGPHATLLGGRILHAGNLVREDEQQRTRLRRGAQGVEAVEGVRDFVGPEHLPRVTLAYLRHNMVRAPVPIITL